MGNHYIPLSIFCTPSKVQFFLFLYKVLRLIHIKMGITPQKMSQTSNALLSPMKKNSCLGKPMVRKNNHRPSKFWDYPLSKMGITSRNMSQTSNSLLSSTIWMVARGNNDRHLKFWDYPWPKIGIIPHIYLKLQISYYYLINKWLLEVTKGKQWHFKFSDSPVPKMGITPWSMPHAPHCTHPCPPAYPSIYLAWFWLANGPHCSQWDYWDWIALLT